MFWVKLISQAITRGVVPPNRDAEILYVIASRPYRTSVKNSAGSTEGIVPSKQVRNTARISNPRNTSPSLPLLIHMKAGRDRTSRLSQADLHDPFVADPVAEITHGQHDRNHDEHDDQDQEQPFRFPVTQYGGQV